ncbi:MAG: hypothetical protein ACRD15_10065 [Vicinamibacterales bacterium]
MISPARFLSAAPGAPKQDTTVLAPSGGSTATSRAEAIVFATSALTLAGAWRMLPDASAANGFAVGHPNAGATKVPSPAATPAHYVEFSFTAEAGRPYRLWLRGRADANHWSNDSVFIQFSGTVNASGQPVFRIGSTDATVVVLEESAGAALSGWGWQDNGYGAGVLGPLLRFQTSGIQRIRLQTREDGLRIDQIVLSSERYLTEAPGAPRNDTTILRP